MTERAGSPASDPTEGQTARGGLIPSIHVNLLPASVRAEEGARKARLVALGCVGLAALAVGGGYLYATSQLNAAQERLDAELVVQGQLQAEAAQYASVPEAYAIVDEASADLATAMATDVRWSFILNDLSLTIPDGVGLTQMSAALGSSTPLPGDDTTRTTVPSDGSDLAPTETLIGAITYSGQARSYDDVAQWLESQSKQPIYADTFFNNATKAENSEFGREVVSFDSTVQLTDAAYSRRFSATAPGGTVTPGPVPTTASSPTSTTTSSPSASPEPTQTGEVPQ